MLSLIIAHKIFVQLIYFHSHYFYFHFYFYFFFIAMIIDTIYIIIMETIFMNTENRKTNESHRFRLDLTDKLNLKNPKKKYGFS